jgi:hypothetical protein
LQEGRESANIDAGLGFIWRISAHYWMKEGAQVRTRIQYWSLSGIGAQTVAGALLYAAVKFSTPINYDLVAA